MRLGLDLDGCVYDFVTEMKFSLFGSTHDVPDPDRWNIWESWGVPKSKFYKIMDNEVRNGHLFSRGKPYHGSIKAIDRLREKGIKIVFVTDRGSWPEAVSQTAHWLDSYAIPYDALVFTQDKTVAGVDLILDDKIGNCNEVGIPSVLFSRPWNVQYEDTLTSDTEVVRSWEEFIKLVEEEEVNGRA